MARHKNYGEKIIALFPTFNSAERTIAELKRLGIRDEDISLAQPKAQRAREAGTHTEVRRIDQPEGSLGGILANIGLGSNLVGALEDLGFAKDTARVYADRVDSGNALLAIRCDGQCERVRTALDKYGAFDVRTTSARAAEYGQPGYTTGREPEVGSRGMPIHEERLIPNKEQRRAGEVQVSKKGELIEEEYRERHER